MKNLLLKLVIYAFLTYVVSSCDSIKINNEIPTLNLCNEINTSSCDHLDLKSWKVTTIYPEVTDSTLLSDLRILKTGDDNIWATNQLSIFRFSCDGKCESIFTRRGEGPEEYYSILKAVVTDNDDIAINDYNTQRISLYKPDGSFISRTIQRFGNFQPGKNGFIGISFPGSCKEGTMAFKLNNTLEPVDSVLISPNRETSKGFVTLLPLENMNGHTCLQLRDTIFSIDNIHEIIPLVALNTGTLHIPEEIEDDFHRRDERAHYINNLFAIIWKSLVFVKYYYGEDAYFDIWDTTKEKLMFRNKGPMAYGFPIETPNGKTINVWPSYSDLNTLAGKIPSVADDSGEETNPGIFIISQKE